MLFLFSLAFALQALLGSNVCYASNDPFTASVRSAFSVQLPENTAGESEVVAMAVTQNNKLVAAIWDKQGDTHKIKVIPLDAAQPEVEAVVPLAFGRRASPHDVISMGSNTVAVTSRNRRDIQLVDVSGDEPVMADFPVRAPFEYEFFSFSPLNGPGSHGQEGFVFAGAESFFSGRMDVVSQSGDIVKTLFEGSEEVVPKYVRTSGAYDAFVEGIDWVNSRDFWRFNTATGQETTHLGSLELTQFKGTVGQFDFDAQGQLYVPVGGDGNCRDPGESFDPYTHGGSSGCVVVVSPDGQRKVVLKSGEYGKFATAVAVTPAGFAVAWRFVDTNFIAIEGFEYE